MAYEEYFAMDHEAMKGGGIWGAATVGKMVFTNIANNDRIQFRLAPSNIPTTAGHGWHWRLILGILAWFVANELLYK